MYQMKEWAHYKAIKEVNGLKFLDKTIHFFGCCYAHACIENAPNKTCILTWPRKSLKHTCRMNIDIDICKQNVQKFAKRCQRYHFDFVIVQYKGNWVHDVFFSGVVHFMSFSM